MSRRLLFTGAFILSTFVPAYADVSYITNASTCDTGTLGSDSSASVSAQWTAKTYSAAPGYYRTSANPDSQTSCPTNSYCAGFTNQTFNDSDMGATACSTLSNGAFPYSANGTSNSAMCYNTGTVNCNLLNPYTGGHGSATYTNSTATYKAYSDWGTPNINTSRDGFFLDTIGSCAIAYLTCDTGYTSSASNGALSAYVTQTVIWADNSGIKYYALNSNSGTNSGDNGQGSHSGMTAGDWEVAWHDGTKVYGTAQCSETSGTLATAGEPSSTSGSYCWCNMDSYSLLGGSTQSVSSSAWVFATGNSSSSDCLSDCASNCAEYTAHNINFRTTLFGSLGANMKCTPNTISINYYNGDSLYSTTSCTYDGSVVLPSEVPSRPGYTFAGWAVQQPAQEEPQGGE